MVFTQYDVFPFSVYFQKRLGYFKLTIKSNTKELEIAK